jgi:FtsH-binding integral membrane protein
MEIMETIWPVVGVVVPLLCGWAGVMVSIAKPDYRLGRILFWVSALLLGVVDFAWQLTTDKPAWFRVLAGLSVAFSVFVILPMLLKWIRKREGGDTR